MEQSPGAPNTPSAGNLALRVTSGRDEGKVFPLVEGFIGKKSSSDYRLTDPKIAAMHARVTLRRDSWHITDLTSAPDIRVNSTVVKSRKILYGDTITIGGTTLQVVDAPPDMVKRRKIETQRMPSVKPDAPPSQTMQISLDQNTEDWKPNKPDPTKRSEDKKDVAAEQPPPSASTVNKTPQRRTIPSSYQRYQNRPLQDDAEAEKSGFRMLVFILILVAVILPLLIGGLYMANKKREKQIFSQELTAARQFEANNPDKLEEIIQQYRSMELLAAGDRVLANVARENIQRVETIAAKHSQKLARILATLDGTAESFTAKGDFAGAVRIYEDYSGEMSTEALAARTDEIAVLKKKAALEARTGTPAAATAPTTVVQAPAMPAMNNEDKLKALVGAAVDEAIKGNIDDAIADLELIAANPSLKAHHGTAAQAVRSMKLLAAVDKAFEAAAESGRTAMDPLDDQSQPTLVRLLYALRKEDMLAAQVLVKGMKGSLLYEDLAARSAMSRAQLLKEQSVMKEFGKSWFAMMEQSSRRIPRPHDCIEMLKHARASKPASAISDFCKTMTDLEKEHEGSHFISRYSPFFKACQATRSAILSKPKQKLASGNAKIIDTEDNKFFFEATDPIQDTDKVAVYTERDIFLDPATKAPAAARLQVISVFQHKKISEKMGTFNIPIDYDQRKPLKGEQLLVGPDLSTGQKLVPIRLRQASAKVIYTADFNSGKYPGWKLHTRRSSNAGGKLELDFGSSTPPPPPGEPNAWYDAKGAKDPVTIQMSLTRHSEAPLAVTVDKLQFMLAGTTARPAGVWFDGHLIKRINVPNLPIGQVIPVTINWTPLFSSMTVAGTTMTSAVDASCSERGLARIGLICESKITINSFKLTQVPKTSGSRLLGVNTEGTAVILRPEPTPEWAALQKGHVIFLLNKKISKKNENTSGWEALPATVVDVTEEIITCSMAKSETFVNSSTIASLTKIPKTSSSHSDANVPSYLPDNGWKPEPLLATVAKNSKGEPVLVPDLPCSYAKMGFVGKTAQLISHPYSHEPLIVAPDTPNATEFEETAGVLMSPILPALVENSTGSQKLLLSGHASTPNVMVPVSPPSCSILPLPSSRSPQGWLELSGAWTHKFGRYLSSPTEKDLSLLQAQTVLWENCQYSLNIKIEAASAKKDVSEILIELYSPFHDRAIALHAGTQGTMVTYDQITRTQEGYTLKENPYAPLQTATPSWDKPFKGAGPKLQPGVSYDVKIRRARGTYAFYINGKRIAKATYPALSGDLLMRAACPAGQVSIGTGSGTMLSRSVIIPSKEPDAGEFGYVLAVEGARILVDADTTGLVKSGKISVMKVNKVLEGKEEKAITLKRIAVGSVVDLTERVASCVTSSPSEPLQPGMKVFAGLLPDNLTMTSATLASVDKPL